MRKSKRQALNRAREHRFAEEIVGFAGRRIGVPLAQLDPVKPDKETRKAVEDWRYWIAMGHGF